MESNKLILKFDDENQSLTEENGLSIQELGKLLFALDKITDGDNVVISNISGNCYALELTSPNQKNINSLRITHNNLKEKKSENWSKKEIRYASTLIKILGKNKNLEVYDKQKTFSIKITREDIINPIQYYYERKIIYGVITLIGSTSLDKRSKPKIILDKQNYSINISTEQENSLKSYYKNNKLKLTLRLRKRISDSSIESANLIDFVIPEPTTLFTSMERFRSNSNIDIDAIIVDAEQMLNNIRNK
jgi:hypothetical protein